MRFTPKTEKQIQEERFPVLPKGIYSFEILNAEEKKSQKGNDMMVIKLKVFKRDGSHTLVTDYITEHVAHKLRHLCVNTGLEKAYEAGSLNAADLQGKSGRVKLYVQKDKSGQYADRNAVDDYVSEDAEDLSDPASVDLGIKEDDIPF